MDRACSAMLWLVKVVPPSFAGTIMLTSDSLIAGILRPTAAIVVGVLGFTLWLVHSLVASDAVKARSRRRPR
ncbi:hypothetical protein NHF46_11230 [Arthrobacter alpinus]|uniref:Uncharacterized protein n=1 Tax=Arthrobacter alpinus TaxID=656366 RepID=A0A0S2LZL7_9MICC|nr:hypothetical protein [Arthrobacter alpinus]ALO66900.1 hypothetical protein AS189_10785 [Arthrobacter alpinus]MDD0858186.1 hypothetical protein [Arthrobacter alpinus]